MARKRLAASSRCCPSDRGFAGFSLAIFGSGCPERSVRRRGPCIHDSEKWRNRAARRLLHPSLPRPASCCAGVARPRLSAAAAPPFPHRSILVAASGRRNRSDPGRRFLSPDRHSGWLDTSIAGEHHGFDRAVCTAADRDHIGDVNEMVSHGLATVKNRPCEHLP